MCELFAMSSRRPATVNLSLSEFARHGGLTDKHKDGWGIAWYDTGDALLVREPRAAAESPSMQFVRHQGIASRYVVSHIRRATVGEVTLRNTQPFARELGGRLHLFVHNGMLHDIEARHELSGRFQPIGETDSEYAFCMLMDRMATIWNRPGATPDENARFELFGEFARQMAALGPANFIYSDGEVIIAHGHERSHRDGIHPPGLHFLCRHCKTEPRPVETTGLKIITEADSQDIVLLASVPLTDESWTQLQPQQLLMLKDGEIVKTSS